MKILSAFKDKLRAISGAFVRYPMTMLLLLAAAVCVAIQIQTDKVLNTTLWALSVGAILVTTAQAVYERFFEKQSSRWLLHGTALLLSFGYYLIIRREPSLTLEGAIRTSVAEFALVVAYIYVPSIKSEIDFNQSFMATFKAFFQAILFAGVLFLGCSLVYAAIDTLIARLNYRVWQHTANVVFVLFAPILFLSLIPLYPGKAQANGDAKREEALAKAVMCPKFLEVLLSYIMLPLAAAFTAIPVYYILRNIGGSFWTNNLLEPMLVSYAIAILILYILASSVENRIAILFRRIFPKVLVPIVLFQIAASLINLRITGLTHTRYFVILFGAFAAISGILLSFLPLRKNGVVAALLIAFAVISIVPPVDAFTVSRVSQTRLLESVLKNNGMLDGGAIVPKSSIPDADKQKIIRTVEYLDMMQYTQTVAFLPKDFMIYEDFEDTFGFSTYDMPGELSKPVNVMLDPAAPILVAGYDTLVRVNYYKDGGNPVEITGIVKGARTYRLSVEWGAEHARFVLRDEAKQEVIGFDTGLIVDRYSGFAVGKSLLTQNEAAFTVENGMAAMRIIVLNANFNTIGIDRYENGEVYILLKIK